MRWMQSRFKQALNDLVTMAKNAEGTLDKALVASKRKEKLASQKGLNGAAQGAAQPAATGASLFERAPEKGSHMKIVDFNMLPPAMPTDNMTEPMIVTGCPAGAEVTAAVAQFQPKFDDSSQKKKGGRGERPLKDAATSLFDCCHAYATLGTERQRPRGLLAIH